MNNNTDTPRTQPNEDALSGAAADVARSVPIGRYTDDPAANAHHSADIADMMADRSRGSAARAAASAATALNALRLAEIAADKAVLAAGGTPYSIHSDRAPIEKILAVIGAIALATLTQFGCVIVVYALAHPVFTTIDNIESPPSVAQWTAPPPKSYNNTHDRAGGARP